MATSRSQRRVHDVHGPGRQVYVIGAIVVVVLVVAIPTVMSSFSEADPNDHPWTNMPPPPPPPPSEAEIMLGEFERATPDVPPPPPEEPLVPPAPPRPKVEASADGDLSLEIKLRWTEIEAGDRLLAKARFLNHSLATVFVPSAGEPNPGFALVIEDAEGNEVRRIVESAKIDPLPRRLERLDSATDVELPLTVIGEDESPLAPGTYSVFLEMKPDPRLARLGVPTWTAPKGPIRSESATLVVRPKTAQ